MDTITSTQPEDYRPRHALTELHVYTEAWRTRDAAAFRSARIKLLDRITESRRVS